MANGTFGNTSIVASGVGNVYVIGVEDQVVVNLAGTAAVSIGADSSKVLEPPQLMTENTQLYPSTTEHADSSIRVRVAQGGLMSSVLREAHGGGISS